MKVQSINNYSRLNESHKPQFKSVYPSVYWIRETNASFIPEFTFNMVKQFNENIISRLNKKAPIIQEEILNLKEKISDLTEKLKNKLPERERISKENQIMKLRNSLADLHLTQRVQAYISRCDEEYAKNPIARGYYISNAKQKENSYSPIAYIATGNDALYLESLGHRIGYARSRGFNQEELDAKIDYWKKGTKYVHNQSKLFKSKYGEPLELHIKMETVRDTSGEKTGLNVLNMKYFPKYGPNNPFMLTEWINK